jgi:hypothetical protein
MNGRLLSLLSLSLLGLMACAPTGVVSSDAAPSGSGGSGTGTGGAGLGGNGSGGRGTGSGGSNMGGNATGGTSTGGTNAGGNGSGGRGNGSGGANTGGSGIGGTGTGGSGGAGAGTGGTTVSTFAVVTDRYDNARSGANTSETILNTTNVNRNTFGLLFSRTIVGYAYAQPLYVGGVTIGGVKHNVVYVVTAHNMVYAFDADALAPDVPLWSRSLGTSLTLGAGAAYNPGCTDMINEVGITSTPVISLADNKIFLVAKTTAGQELHSLDLATGADAAGSPIPVGEMAMTAFDSHAQLSRAGLLLMGGVVYIAYSSHCDLGTYHGWVFGYDAQTLQLRSVYNPTPTGTGGSIWQSGAGLASDGTSIWASVGNGTTGGQNMGFNVIRLMPAGSTMTVVSRFQGPADGDDDMQGGATLLGSSGQVVSGNKNGNTLFLLGQTDLAMRQTINLGGEVNTFAFWNGSAGPTLFAWPVAGGLRSYVVAAGSLTDKGTNVERRPGHPSAIFTVSSNGATANTGIVWATVPLADAWHMTVPGFLYAYNAANVAAPSLWNSTLVATDAVGNYAKYSPPTVANGKVYVATFSGKLQVYGLK